VVTRLHNREIIELVIIEADRAVEAFGIRSRRYCSDLDWWNVASRTRFLSIRLRGREGLTEPKEWTVGIWVDFG
jgi:hypothetical protein